MSAFSSILGNGVVSNLGVYPASHGGIQELVTQSAYVPSVREDGRGLVLNQVSTEEFVKKITFDFERFALSSRESFLVAVSEKEEFGSLGWPLLKFYYASFFAAHAIMRSRGAGIIKLDRSHVDHLNDIASIYELPPPSLTPGMYAFKRAPAASNSAGELSLVIYPDTAGSGVHEGFWLNFCRFLDDEAANSVEKGEIDSASFVALSNELREAVTRGPNSGGVWLSAIRNQINYQHKYDTWLPYRRSSEGYKALDNVLQTFLPSGRLDVSKTRKPVESFLNVTCYVSTLAFDVCEMIAKTSTRGGAFGQKWRRINGLLGPHAN